MVGGQEIKAKRAVVSATCYQVTSKLLSESARQKYHLPLTVPGVEPSAGFVMCNIGIKASPESIGATNTNTWHVRLYILFDILLLLLYLPIYLYSYYLYYFHYLYYLYE